MRGRIPFSLFLLLVMLGSASSGIASSSSWVVSNQASSRLVAASPSVSAGAAAIKLGWQVRLAKGWKTYWRNPGDAGLPPRFDWAGSTNVEKIRIDWPTPERLTVFGYETLVYAQEVVLPITVTLVKPGSATRLNLKVDYMICEEICILLEARYRLDLPLGEAARTEAGDLIARYQAQVPLPQTKLGRAVGAHPLELSSAALTSDGIELVVRGAKGMDGLDAFVDGPETVAFGRPKVVATSAADLKMLRVPVHGAKPTELAGQDLAIVLVNGAGDSVEWRGKVSE